MNRFTFSNSKNLLKGHISSLPKRGHGEISKIARHLGVSTTWVSQVLRGEKILTPEQSQEVAEYLNLTPAESDYFAYLIQFERAGTPKLREFWKVKLDDSRQRSLVLATRVTTDHILTDSERAVFYSSALYSAIRTFTSVGEKGKTLEEIYERFQISRTKASLILDFLTKAGLCKVADEKFFVGPQKTHLEQNSPFATKHHSNWRVRAIRKSEDLAPEELMYTAPVSLSHKDFQILREEMVQFIQSFLKRVHASPAEEVACFNMDFFWIEK